MNEQNTKPDKGRKTQAVVVIRETAAMDNDQIVEDAVEDSAADEAVDAVVVDIDDCMRPVLILYLDYGIPSWKQ